jgi:signal transduction histidine kinase
MSLAVLDDGTDTFRVDATYGTASWRLPSGSTIPIDDGLRKHFDRGNSLVVHDTTLVNGQPMEELASRGLRSFLSVPVIIAGKTRLLVNFVSTRANAFRPHDITLMQTAVRETAGTLHALLMLDRERQATTQLQQLDTLKNEFVGMVAHDLRSPMNVIAGFADTMRDRWAELDEDQKLEFLGIISGTVRELAELIEDVLHVARIESGELSYRMTPFDLAGLIRRTVNQLSAMQPEREVRVSVAPGVPPAFGDEQRHWQIISNLITNAFKFSEVDSPVEVTVEASDGFITVSVRDHGIGIEAEDLDKVFDKFSRVTQPGRKSKVKGTGLGLFICRTMVEHQGGTIDVKSSVGIGSTFTYTVRTAEEGWNPA